MRKIEDIVAEEAIQRRNLLLKKDEIYSSIIRGDFKLADKVSFLSLTLGLNLRQCNGIITDLKDQEVTFLESYYKHTNINQWKI